MNEINLYQFHERDLNDCVDLSYGASSQLFGIAIIRSFGGTH